MREWAGIQFMPAPADRPSRDHRLTGTVTNRSGLEFTGYVTWDRDEVFGSDVLDGSAHGDDHEIAFRDISSIERVGRSGARVLLRNGDEVVLRDSNDVDDGNRDISVSDLDMGQALLDWDEFDRVEFHPIVVTDYIGFDGGQRLHGTVVTESGEELTGEISWDNDENFTWEMLNGDSKGVDFQIEFSRIESIVNLGDGARVLLKDGRSYSLYDSNDVDDGNRGITIRTGGRDVEVEWEEFVEMRIH